MPYKISQDKLNNVKSLINSGALTKDIVHRTGVSKATINRIKITINPDYNRTPPGKRSIIPAYTSQIIKYKLRHGYLKDARDVCKYLKGIGYMISYRATRYLIRQLGFKACLKKKTAFLKHIHMKRRLKWANEHSNWTVDDWKKVIFSDETKINLWGSDGAEYTYRLRGDPILPHHYKPTMKHDGGSLMIWGCITSFGLGYACRIDDYPMDSDVYIHILSTSYKDTLDYYQLQNNDVIFQHDGDPKHTSTATKKWLCNNHIVYIKDWPANSPDLNPIENLWHHLKLRLDQYSTKPKNKAELWERIDTEWNKFTQADIEPYYRSMPNRIKEVIKAKGGYTKH